MAYFTENYIKSFSWDMSATSQYNPNNLGTLSSSIELHINIHPDTSLYTTISQPFSFLFPHQSRLRGMARLALYHGYLGVLCALFLFIHCLHSQGLYRIRITKGCQELRRLSCAFIRNLMMWLVVERYFRGEEGNYVVSGSIRQ